MLDGILYRPYCSDSVPHCFPLSVSINPPQLFLRTTNTNTSEGIQLVYSHSAIVMPYNRSTYAAQQIQLTRQLTIKSEQILVCASFVKVK